MKANFSRCVGKGRPSTSCAEESYRLPSQAHRRSGNLVPRRSTQERCSLTSAFVKLTHLSISLKQLGTHWPNVYNPDDKRDMVHSWKTDMSSNFTAHRINRTTFAVREDDAFREHPLIYVKIHQTAPIIILSDTGVDEVSEEHKHGKSRLHSAYQPLQTVFLQASEPVRSLSRYSTLSAALC